MADGWKIKGPSGNWHANVYSTEWDAWAAIVGETHDHRGMGPPVSKHVAMAIQDYEAAKQKGYRVVEVVIREKQQEQAP